MRGYITTLCVAVRGFGFVTVCFAVAVTCGHFMIFAMQKLDAAVMLLAGFREAVKTQFGCFHFWINVIFVSVTCLTGNIFQSQKIT